MKLHRFTTRELTFLALMAALTFVVNLVVSAGIIAATGVPASSGLITGLTNGIFVTFVALTVRRYGALALFSFIYSVLALPTNMAGGPPGFVWKIPIMVISALIAEFILCSMHHRKLGFIIAIPVYTVIDIGATVLAYWLLGLPELDALLNLVYLITVMFIVLGYVGMSIGFVLYNKMSKKRIIRQISA